MQEPELPTEPEQAESEASSLSAGAAATVMLLGAAALALGQLLGGSGWPLAVAPAAILVLAIAGTRRQCLVGWLVLSAGMIAPHFGAGWPVGLMAQAALGVLADVGLMMVTAVLLRDGTTAFGLVGGVALARVTAEVVWDLTPFGEAFAWGQHLLDWSTFSQAAAIIGLKGVSFLIVFLSGALAVYSVDSERPVARRTTGLALAMVALTVGHGASRLEQSSGEVLRVAAVGTQVGGRRELLTATAAVGAVGADLVVWPEAAVPLPEVLGDEVRRQIGIICAEHELWLAVGAVDPVGGRSVAVLVDPDGVLDEGRLYDQVHAPLVPAAARGRHAPLPHPTTFGGIATLVGDDLLDGNLARVTCRAGATVLLVPADSQRSVTRDQLLLARARAIENSCIVVLAAQHGTAAVCDPFGRVVTRHSTVLEPEYQLGAEVSLVRGIQPGIDSRGVVPWLAVIGLATLLAVRPRPTAYDAAPFEVLYRYDG